MNRRARVIGKLFKQGLGRLLNGVPAEVVPAYSAALHYTTPIPSSWHLLALILCGQLRVDAGWWCGRGLDTPPLF